MDTKWLELLQSSFSEYGYWLVFFSLFLENVLFLGAIIPGALVLVFSGWFAQQGQMPPSLLVLIGFLGTVAGDSVSYAMGKKAGGRLLQSEKWGKGFTSVSARVRDEPALLMFCHFGSYLRMLVPATAGMSGIPFLRWLALDATGALLWVTSHVAVGYFLSRSMAATYMRSMSLIVLALLVAVVSLRYFLKRRRAG